MARATRSAVRCLVPVSLVGTVRARHQIDIALAIRDASADTMIAPSIFASSESRCGLNSTVEKEAAGADGKHLGTVTDHDESASLSVQDALQAVTAVPFPAPPWPELLPWPSSGSAARPSC